MDSFDSLSFLVPVRQNKNITIKIRCLLGGYIVLKRHFQQYFSYIVLLMGDTRVLRENNWLVASHWQTLSHNVVSGTPPARTDNFSGDRHWLHM